MRNRRCREASAGSCGCSVSAPPSRWSSTSGTSLAARRANRTVNPPLVSVALMSIADCRRIGPRSNSGVIRWMVIPPWTSPSRICQKNGEGPRYRGSRDGWTFTPPRGDASSTDCGRILGYPMERSSSAACVVPSWQSVKASTSSAARWGTPALSNTFGTIHGRKSRGGGAGTPRQSTGRTRARTASPNEVCGTIPEVACTTHTGRWRETNRDHSAGTPKSPRRSKTLTGVSFPT